MPHVAALIAGLLYLQHTFDLRFSVDSITNRNYCGCLSSVLSPVKARVAPLVRVSSKFVVTASFIVGPKPEKKANDGHRSIAVYLLDDNRQWFMGTVGVPDRYRLPKEREIVEVQYLYCHPGPDGKLIQAKYFGKVRDDIEIAECGVSPLKVKSNGSGSIES